MSILNEVTNTDIEIKLDLIHLKLNEVLEMIDCLIDSDVEISLVTQIEDVTSLAKELRTKHIKRLNELGATNKDIASAYGLTKSRVSQIHTGNYN